MKRDKTKHPVKQVKNQGSSEDKTTNHMKQDKRKNRMKQNHESNPTKQN